MSSLRLGTRAREIRGAAAVGFEALRCASLLAAALHHSSASRSVGASWPTPGSTKNNEVMRVIVYNPLSLRHPWRAHDLSAEFQNYDIIALIGVQLPADREHPTAALRGPCDLPHHWMVTWGYGRGRYTNKSASVSVLVRRRTFGETAYLP